MLITGMKQKVSLGKMQFCGAGVGSLYVLAPWRVKVALAVCRGTAYLAPSPLLWLGGFLLALAACFPAD